MVSEFLKKHKISVKSISKMEGYDSINYRITDHLNRQYVLKQYRNKKDYDLICAESEIVNLIDEKSPLLYPNTIHVDGKALVDQQQDSFTRLTNFIEGQFLQDVELSKDLLVHFGEVISELHIICADFSYDLLEKKLFNGTFVIII